MRSSKFCFRSIENCAATQREILFLDRKLDLAYSDWYLATKSKKSLQASEGFKRLCPPF
jgi:hypothetical protein